jgi:photolyase PhrII
MNTDLSPEVLPDHLRERIWRLTECPPRRDGALVLYWMHHAVRGHENPALDVARLAADALGLPLLVYQGLAGCHRYNADRHHWFIIEGVRDAHAELRRTGLRPVLHVPADPLAPSPLRELAARSALVIGEDFPAPPFPRWAHGLAARIDAPLWLVDCACVVPMRAQPRRFERAFELRRHNRTAYAERVPRAWPALDQVPAAWDDPLPFTPVDLDDVDLAALCAGCAIDHSLGPVTHTRGGSAAGYARWDRFKREGLASYHALRNDAAVAWPRGVSRLSPYLHHGQVSPFRIAREAAAIGGEGAEKFLDELLIWRELAHNFALHTPEPESLEALPAWARETLEAHAADPRPALIDDESLARAGSGDRLWDLAQRSLLIHGELHNNLRMTWAKAIPGWTPSPAAALKQLVDLNHRHALDGSDPNSYGGLLWALGLFDRPFSPERPVTGRLRGRDTSAHARRLDIQRYARRVELPSGPRLRVAIVGAGLAGIGSARTLQDQGHDVVLFEKSRDLGGRAATRRIGANGNGRSAVGFDHGAQYFTVSDPRFLRRVQAWAARGLVAPWQGRLGVWDGARVLQGGGDDRRWVGVPGMSGLARGLATGLAVRLGCRIAPPRREQGGWRLRDEDGELLGRFDRLLIAVPAPQAAVLLDRASVDMGQRAGAVSFAPAWSLMLELEHPLPLPFDGLFCNVGPLRWVASNGSKWGRLGQTCVAIASPDWSRRRLDDEADAIAAALTDAVVDVCGGEMPRILWSGVQRWRYAQPDPPLELGCLWDGALGVGACGDWCLGARIESAWLSGEALAGRVLCDLAQRTEGTAPSRPA